MTQLARGSSETVAVFAAPARFLGVSTAAPHGQALRPLMTVHCELRARLTNQPLPFHPLTLLCAGEYGRGRDHVAKDRRMTGPTSTSLPPLSQLSEYLLARFRGQRAKCALGWRRDKRKDDLAQIKRRCGGGGGLKEI